MLDLKYHDFRAAMWLIWNRIGLPDPTPVQYEMAHFIQYGGPKIFMSAFRGAAKSYACAAYVDWSHAMSDHWGPGCTCDACKPMVAVNGIIRPRDLRFRVVSAASDKVREFTGFAKRIITEVPEFQHLRPTESDAAWAMDRFDVQGAPIAQVSSVTATGIFGQLTGGRANELIWDDVETPNTSETVGQRQKLRQRMTEFSALMIPEYERKIGLGTPQCEESITDEMSDKGYVVKFWPVEYPTTAEKFAWGGRLADSIRDAPDDMVGKSVEPTRFNELILAEKKVEMGLSAYRLQFLLDTSLSDADRHPLKLKDLVVMDVDQEKVPDKIVWASGPDQVHKDLDPVGFTGDFYHRPMFTSDQWATLRPGTMYIDPSGKGKDETGYAVVKESCGTLFATECSGHIGGYEDHVLRALAITAKLQRCALILVEQNFGQGMFSQLLKPIVQEVWRDPAIGDYVGHGCTIEEVRSSGQKELRIIDTLEPLMNQHRLVVDKGVFERDRKTIKGVPEKDQMTYRLAYQLTRITKDRGCLKHDDRLDALAGACQYWVESMAKHRTVSAGWEEKARREAEWQEYRKELEELGTPHWKANKPKVTTMFNIRGNHGKR